MIQAWFIGLFARGAPGFLSKLNRIFEYKKFFLRFIDPYNILNNIENKAKTYLLWYCRRLKHCSEQIKDNYMRQFSIQSIACL